MTAPAILLGFLLSTLYGAAFHLIRGGGAGRLLLDLILGWLGFWIGHFLGARLGLDFAMVGPLHLGMATAGSLLFLFIGNWLSLAEPADKDR